MKFIFSPITGQCIGIEREEDENVQSFAAKDDMPIYQAFRNLFDKFTNTKETLLADVFSMNGSDDFEELVSLQLAIEGLMIRLNLHDDEQLKNAIGMAELYQVENANETAFDKMYIKIESTIHRLMARDNWDEVDTLQASRISGHAINLDVLERFNNRIIAESRKREALNTELCTRMNMHMRLVRMRHREAYKMVDHEKVTELFRENSKEIRKLFKKTNYPVFKEAFLIREAMFDKDFTKMKEGVSILEKLGEHDIANAIAKEINHLFEINLGGEN